MLPLTPSVTSGFVSIHILHLINYHVIIIIIFTFINFTLHYCNDLFFFGT